MAQFVVRRLEEAVKAKLQRRARRNGWSMEQEVRNILRMAVIRDEFSAQENSGVEPTLSAQDNPPRRYRVRSPLETNEQVVSHASSVDANPAKDIAAESISS